MNGLKLKDYEDNEADEILEELLAESEQAFGHTRVEKEHRLKILRQYYYAKDLACTVTEDQTQKLTTGITTGLNSKMLGAGDPLIQIKEEFKGLNELKRKLKVMESAKNKLKSLMEKAAAVVAKMKRDDPTNTSFSETHEQVSGYMSQLQIQMHEWQEQVAGVH